MDPPGSQHGQIVAKAVSKTSKSVLFVCYANQCRSPMAMILFKDLVARSEEKLVEWRIESAGTDALTGYPATKDAAFVISEMGLNLHDHRSQPITGSLLNGFNLILCMENDQIDTLKQSFPTAKKKSFSLKRNVRTGSRNMGSRRKSSICL